MSTHDKSGLPHQPVTRREFIKGSAVAAALPALGAEAVGKDPEAPAPNKKPPNIIIIIADQFRWDALGANGLNSMGLTPNLDAMARRGTLFRSHIANQPVCAPSRANLFTGQYQNINGVWRNGLGLAPDAVMLATTLRQAGYTANYIGKWHLARPVDDHPAPEDRVAPDRRGGFDDLWEGANALEHTSHPYQGELYDAEGKPIHFSDVYRVDFLAQRAVRFLRQASHQPFLLVVSQLEPHFQNDCNCFVGPQGYADRYANPFVPGDLKFFPGDWPKQLPDYYGCCASIDESVGTILGTLRELGMEENTIVVFLSDHGCHFRTRNSEYKRSPHESSIHIPLVVQGPGFNRSLSIPELTSQIDITPTLLQAAGLPIPASMQGRSFLPLLDRKVEGWRDEVYIQITESQTGRALRTPPWTYAVVDAHYGRRPASASDQYTEYQMYNNFDDPHQLLNLAGRRDDPRLIHYQGAISLKDATAHLRERLLARMVEAGEPRAEIQERLLYP
jgi:arylsulfatase A-like enzyme